MNNRHRIIFFGKWKNNRGKGEVFLKRLGLFLSAFLLLFLLVLTGCTKSSQSDGENASDVEVSDPGEFPITEEKVTLKVLAAQRKYVENFSTNEFTKWFEEKTNVHLEWEVVPEGEEAKQKLNLTLASGDYPDLYLNMPISAQQLEVFGNQDVFLQLNDLIDEQSVELKKVFEENPVSKKMVTSNDGNIYSVPDVNECFQCMYPVKMWVNQKWLDELDLKMPETTEDLYKVLKAFKTEDPNGNGKADEVPLAGYKGGWNSDFVPLLMNAFIFTKSVEYDGSVKYTYLKDGKIDVAFNKPEWRKGLEYMHKLYKEGLIAPESFTQDRNQIIRLAEGEKALGVTPGGYQLVYTNLTSGLYKDYTAIPPLKGPEGKQYAEMLNNKGVGTGKFVVSNSTKYPEVAMRLADAFYNEEVQMRALYGEEGDLWREAKEGEVGLEGDQADYFINEAGEQMQNEHWNQAAPHYRSREWLNSLALTEKGGDPTDDVIYLVNQETKKYVTYVDEKVIVPPLILSDQQSQEILDIQKSIQDYVDEMTIGFITGDSSLDSDWDNYVKSIEDMNLKRYLEILQEAYEVRYEK